MEVLLFMNEMVQYSTILVGWIVAHYIQPQSVLAHSRVLYMLEDNKTGYYY